MPYAYGDTVTIRRRTQTGTDRYGNPVWTWADVASVPHVAVAPATTTEPVQVARNEVITSWTLYLPPGTDVRALDRVLVRGREWDVDGEPSDWRNPYTGTQAGIAVSLKDVEG